MPRVLFVITAHQPFFVHHTVLQIIKLRITDRKPGQRINKFFNGGLFTHRLRLDWLPPDRFRAVLKNNGRFTIGISAAAIVAIGVWFGFLARPTAPASTDAP